MGCDIFSRDYALPSGAPPTVKAVTLSKCSTGLSFQQTVLLTPLANTLAIDQEMFSGSVDAGFVLALPFAGWGGGGLCAG